MESLILLLLGSLAPGRATWPRVFGGVVSEAGSAEPVLPGVWGPRKVSLRAGAVGLEGDGVMEKDCGESYLRVTS